jgi:glycosyltransferase involved in cell wall biosynthesis
MSKKIKLSIVIPAYNERQVLPLCYSKLSQILFKLKISYEIIFIDDGSKDGSADYLAGLAEAHPFIVVIYLSRNFGKEAALTAGIEYASGEAVIMLDADLQDPPELIPKMLMTWQQKKVDVVLMRRRTRAGETVTKKLTAFWYYRLLNRLSEFDIPEDTGDFRLMSRQAIDALRQLPERNRYMKGLFSWIGMDTVVIEYDREPRAAGQIKSHYPSLLRLAIQGITSFSIAPLRLAMILGVIVASFGTLFGLWIIAKAILWGDPVQGYPSMMAIITFLGGTQLFTIGILGEYVGKTYIESKQRPNYLIKKIRISQSSA